LQKDAKNAKLGTSSMERTIFQIFTIKFSKQKNKFLLQVG